MRKEIKLLWLYDDLLDLYGDNGNIKILSYYLSRMDIDLTIHSVGIHDELSFEEYDMIYCGPGKLKNLVYAANHLRQYKEQLKEAIEDKVVLFTGSSILLLGEYFTDSLNNKTEATGIFPFTAHDENKIEIADVLSYSSNHTSQPIYGFINRTAHIQYTGEITHLFNIQKGLKEQKEGICYHDLWATMQLGPLLVKNPSLLEIILTKLTKQPVQLNNTLETEAYHRTISELK